MSRKKLGWLFAFLGIVLIGISLTDFERLWLLTLIGITPYLAFLVGLSKQCPKCERWWASVEDKSKLLDRWHGTKDVAREDIQEDSNGKEIGRTKRTEQVIVTFEKRKHYYHCRYCDNKWEATKTHQNR